MRRYAFLCALSLCVGSAGAVERIELSVDRIEGAGWQLRGLRADWRLGGAVSASAHTVEGPGLPAPAAARLRCARIAAPALRCDDASAELDIARLGSVDARFAVDWTSARHWLIELRELRAQLSYNSADGRLAADRLQAALSGSVRTRGGTLGADLQLRAAAGQAYAEPIFVDFGAHPFAAHLRGSWTDSTLAIERLTAAQSGIGTVVVRGTVDTRAPTQAHALTLDVDVSDGTAASELYAKPLLVSTPVKDSSLAGAARIGAEIHDGMPRALQLKLDDAVLVVPAYGLRLAGLSGHAAWRAQAPATPSALHWRDGSIGRVPLGGAALRFQTAGRDFELSAALQLPVLDGRLDVERLALRGLGTEALGADFAARIEPIDLKQLCRALGWPEFSGTLAGRLPGLRLRERRLDIDGTLRASAFDGEIEVRELTVIEPFGVLPRIRTDIRLRRLDLAALTGAFDFGRITGRLDGDIENLRLLGWTPVAMDARLYTTPGDRSRHRISQRAIDSISSIGGGPTGLLQRGFFSLFEDFAYDRIGWSCRLDNGVCIMDGIHPHEDGRGYVLVEGKGLPRIDVVGYSRRVSWHVFLSQLRSAIEAGPAQVQ
ncbi:MAG: hypothetical protein AB1651_07830 [Pseudomonadota bacterium]